MNITINLTGEQIKALLTEYQSIESYVQSVVENRANRIINEIVKDYAKDKVRIKPLMKTEQSIVDKLKSRIVTNTDNIPDDIKKIIVRKADVKTAVEKAEKSKMV